jgi:MFS family permease
VSSLFLSGVVGALLASVTSRKYGRRDTMLAGGLAFLIGALVMAGGVHMAMLIAGRLAMGLGVGLTTQAAPLFLSEMAPFKLRGALNIMFQLAVAVGIFAAQLINYGTQVRFIFFGGGAGAGSFAHALTKNRARSMRRPIHNKKNL